MTAYTVVIDGTPVAVVPSDVDYAHARVMLDRRDSPQARAELAKQMVADLTDVGPWVREHGVDMAQAMAHIAVAVVELQAPTVAAGVR